MEIYFSGDDFTDPVEESIWIPETTVVTSLMLKAYDAGVANLNITWTGQSPCTLVPSKCVECTAECENGFTPVCDGTKEARCVPTLQALGEKEKCDFYSNECNAVLWFDLPQCTWGPTSSPSEMEQILPIEEQLVQTRSLLLNETTRANTCKSDYPTIFRDWYVVCS